MAKKLRYYQVYYLEMGNYFTSAVVAAHSEGEAMDIVWNEKGFYCAGIGRVVAWKR